MRLPYWQRLLALEAATAFGVLLAFLVVDSATEASVTGVGLLVGVVGLSVFGLPATSLAAAATLTRKEIVVAAVGVIGFLTYLGQLQADSIDSSTSGLVYLYFPTMGSGLATLAILARIVLSVVVKSYNGGKWHEAMNEGQP